MIMKTKKSLLLAILAILIGSPSVSQAQDALSLEQFRDMVRGYSMQLKMSREQTSAATSKFKSVRTGFYPSLSASAEANYFTNSPMQLDLPAGIDMSLKDFSYSASATIQQNVYAGHAVANQTKAAKIEIDIASMGEDLTLENVVYAADVTYWALSASRTQLNVMNRYVAIVGSLYDIVKIRFNDGYVSKTDLLMVETRLNEAKIQQIAAQKLYRTSLHNLNTMIGQYRPIEYSVSDTIGSPNHLPQFANLDYALENRSDYRMALRQVDLLNMNVRLARAKFNPQLVVGMTGNWGTSNPNLSGKTNLYGVVFASFRAPIFHWNERRHLVSQARSGVRSQEFSVIDTRDGVARDLLNAQTSLEQSFAQAEVANNNLSIAQNSLELNTYSYSEGRLPILDVLSAQLSWIQSYTAAVNANYQYKVSTADYNKALGIAAE